MEGMGLKFIPAGQISQRPSKYVWVCDSVAGTSWTYTHVASPNTPNEGFNLPKAVHPFPLHTLPLPPIPLYMGHLQYSSGYDKVAQDQAVLTSYISEIVINTS